MARRCSSILPAPAPSAAASSRPDRIRRHRTSDGRMRIWRSGRIRAPAAFFALLERIVAELGHDDAVVGLGRTADTFEGQALIEGILHAGFHRAVPPGIDRVVESGGDLPDFPC